MSDASLFICFFGGLLVVRIIAATFVFVLLTPRTDLCPHCNAVTIRVEKRAWNKLMPWFRTSWCLECGWEGMLRPGVTTPSAAVSNEKATLSGTG